MYVGDGTWLASLLLLAVAGGVWFWNDSLRSREQMLATCARLCRELRIQFLDETVSLMSLRLGRSAAGWPEFTRVYLFEFSGTGQDRWQGRATLAGRRVLSVQFDHPEGVTILGAGASVSPGLLRLPQSRNDERLH
ncbi:MAG TPA: DUF3301 domain-containing protein [Gammaproteobacteria bacterium]|nr:DUF3301 domain-containing protein [Gammaproteobacteria bacterium]